jgi:transposase
MQVRLHANATTTPRIRAYIQASAKPVAELVEELGVSETTIRRWRSRDTVADGSHVPKRLTTSLSELEEGLICELRRSLDLPLDDITEVMRRCVNGKLSRSAIHRCLKRHGISRRPKPDKPPVGTFETTGVGFIHVDLKHLPALRRQKSYAFVAIDRATRYVYLEIHPQRDAETAAGFLRRFLAHFPYQVHTILTDNGSEFTDRFAVDMKNKPDGRPSGRHPFDGVCAAQAIKHRLTRPYRPQTNGLVERFNRRLADAIRARQAASRNGGKNKFDSHPERNAFLARFVEDYNRTRLKCLAYMAPLEALNNPPGPNTKAGVWRDVDPIKIAQMSLDLPHAHAAAVHRDDLVVKPGKAPLIFGDQLRVEGRPPITGHLDLDLAGVGQDRLPAIAIAAVPITLASIEMMVHLGVQRPLGQRLLQFVEQPVLVECRLGICPRQ